MKGFSGFKNSPAKKHNPTPHFLEKKPNPMVKAQKKKSTYNEKEEQTIENMSNAKDNNFKAEVKKTKFEKMTEEEYQEYMNEKHHSNVPTINDFIGDAQNKQKASNKKSKKTKPSFPATPEGSKQRSKAEKALEAKEDAEGK
mgnify:CR=1 FL=1